MKSLNQKQKIVFCTFSNYESGAFGDANNDRKLFSAIPSIYRKIVLYPKFNPKGKLNFKSRLEFLIYYLNEIFTSKKILITRGSKLAFLPILLRPVFKNKVIIRMGCTPLMFVERMAFSYNSEFTTKNTLLRKILLYLEALLEKYVLRNADKFLVENIKAKKIIMFYGAKTSKIEIIPYYVQDYFQKGNNPEFNHKNDYLKIGYTGRFKKYDLLVPVINAISLLKEKNYQIKLYLIGDGPNRKKMENLVNKMDLAKDIIFLGSKSNREVSNLINEYHCLVLPMLNNLCPSTVAIKILEGVIKGKIIVTTESGNNSSLFLKNKDLIITNISDYEIVERLELVIKNYDKYRRIAGEISEFHIKFRSKENNSRKISQLLDKLIIRKVSI